MQSLGSVAAEREQPVLKMADGVDLFHYKSDGETLIALEGQIIIYLFVQSSGQDG